MSKKSPTRKKTRYLQVRVQGSELEIFHEAANLAGVTMSVWVRDRLRQVAKIELEQSKSTACRRDNSSLER